MKTSILVLFLRIDYKMIKFILFSTLAMGLSSVFYVGLISIRSITFPSICNGVSCVEVFLTFLGFNFVHLLIWKFQLSLCLN